MLKHTSILKTIRLLFVSGRIAPLAILLVFSVPSTAQLVELDLKPDTSFFGNYSFYVQSVEDVRRDRLSIGFVRSDSTGRYFFADLKGGLVPSLENFFKYSVKMDKVRFSTVLAITKLKINEYKTEYGEKGRIDLGLVWIEPDSVRNILYESNQSIELEGNELTPFWTEIIKAGIKTSCIEFDSLYRNHKLPAKKILHSFDDLILDTEPPILTIQNSELHISTASQRNEGIYNSWNEMATNNPSKKSKFTYTVSSGVLIQLYNEKDQRITKAFGFSIDNKLYINKKRYIEKEGYARVVEVGRYLAWYDDINGAPLIKDPMLKRSTKPVLTGYPSSLSKTMSSIAFQRIFTKTLSAGVGALLGIAGGLAFIVAIERDALECIIMDTETGAVLPLNTVQFQNLIRQDEVLWKEFQENKSKIRRAQTQIEWITKFNQRNPFSINPK